MAGTPMADTTEQVLHNRTDQQKKHIVTNGGAPQGEQNGLSLEAHIDMITPYEWYTLPVLENGERMPHAADGSR